MKKMYFTAFLIVCFVLCHMPLVCSEAEGVVNSSVLDARNGVVRVVCLISSDSYSTGTGFAVGPKDGPVEYIVTNNHVVNGNPNDVYIVLDSIENPDGMQHAAVVSTWSDPDIAILKLDVPIKERKALPISALKAQVTQDVYAIGFPGTADEFNDKKDILPSGISDMTVTPGKITKLEHIYKEIKYIQTDAPVNKGNSGGPLLDTHGNVIGIVTLGIVWQTTQDDEGNESYIPASNTSYAIYIDYVVDFFNNHGISYWNGDSKTPVSWVWIGIGGGVILLLFIAGLIANKRGKSDNSAKQPDQQPAAKPGLSRSSSNMARIRGLTGIYGGSDFIVQGNIVMGRDPARCNIVYPAKAVGISAVHCEIKETSEGVVLTDLNSTCGTYLDNGTKVLGGKPVSLKHGDRFYLGTSENTFTVE